MPSNIKKKKTSEDSSTKALYSKLSTADWSGKSKSSSQPDDSLLISGRVVMLIKTGAPNEVKVDLGVYMSMSKDDKDVLNVAIITSDLYAREDSPMSIAVQRKNCRMANLIHFPELLLNLKVSRGAGIFDLDGNAAVSNYQDGLQNDENNAPMSNGVDFNRNKRIHSISSNTTTVSGLNGDIGTIIPNNKKTKKTKSTNGNNEGGPAGSINVTTEVPQVASKYDNGKYVRDANGQLGILHVADEQGRFMPLAFLRQKDYRSTLLTTDAIDLSNFIVCDPRSIPESIRDEDYENFYAAVEALKSPTMRQQPNVSLPTVQIDATAPNSDQSHSLIGLPASNIPSSNGFRPNVNVPPVQTMIDATTPNSGPLHSLTGLPTSSIPSSNGLHPPSGFPVNSFPVNGFPVNGFPVNGAFPFTSGSSVNDLNQQGSINVNYQQQGNSFSLNNMPSSNSYYPTPGFPVNGFPVNGAFPFTSGSSVNDLNQQGSINVNYYQQQGNSFSLNNMPPSNSFYPTHRILQESRDLRQITLPNKGHQPFNNSFVKMSRTSFGEGITKNGNNAYLNTHSDTASLPFANTLMYDEALLKTMMEERSCNIGYLTKKLNGFRGTENTCCYAKEKHDSDFIRVEVNISKLVTALLITYNYVASVLGHFKPTESVGQLNEYGQVNNADGAETSHIQYGFVHLLDGTTKHTSLKEFKDLFHPDVLSSFHEVCANKSFYQNVMSKLNRTPSRKLEKLRNVFYSWNEGVSIPHLDHILYGEIKIHFTAFLKNLTGLTADELKSDDHSELGLTHPLLADSLDPNSVLAEHQIILFTLEQIMKVTGTIRSNDQDLLPRDKELNPLNSYTGNDIALHLSYLTEVLVYKKCTQLPSKSHTRNQQSVKHLEESIAYFGDRIHTPDQDGLYNYLIRKGSDDNRDVATYDKENVKAIYRKYRRFFTNDRNILVNKIKNDAVYDGNISSMRKLSYETYWPTKEPKVNNPLIIAAESIPFESYGYDDDLLDEN